MEFFNKHRDYLPSRLVQQFANMYQGLLQLPPDRPRSRLWLYW